MAPAAAAWAAPTLCSMHIRQQFRACMRPRKQQVWRIIHSKEARAIPGHGRCRSRMCVAVSNLEATEAAVKPMAPRRSDTPEEPEVPEEPEALPVQEEEPRRSKKIDKRLASSRPQSMSEEEAAHAWEQVLQMQAHNETWKGNIQSLNRGGVVVSVHGLRGFIPLSRLSPDRLRAIDRQEDQEGMPIWGKVVQVNVPKRDLILSETATMVEQLADRLQAGDVVDGVVTKLADFGAFVSIRSPDDGQMHGAVGLIHISELSWSRVTNIESIVQPGSEVQCKLIEINVQQGRIKLSLKQMEGDPLKENLDQLLPLTDSGVRVVPASLPSAVEDICSALMEEEGVDAVDIGRQVEEKRAVSQDLELWMSKEAVQDGHNLVVRTGRLVQEIHVTTQMPGASMKEAVQRVLRKMV